MTLAFGAGALAPRLTPSCKRGGASDLDPDPSPPPPLPAPPRPGGPPPPRAALCERRPSAAPPRPAAPLAFPAPQAARVAGLEAEAERTEQCAALIEYNLAQVSPGAVVLGATVHAARGD